MIRLIGAVLLCPSLAFAAGGMTNTPPKTTETSTSCATGLVWDAKSQSCVAPKDSRLNDNIRYDAVRELAYHGRIEAAQMVLSAMTNQQAPEVLTYWGFTHGKKGNYPLALEFYTKALATDPDNLLARSYMGQALVASGDFVGAREQALEITSRGGAGTWPDISLRNAIESGAGYNY